MNSKAVDIKHFRKALSQFPTGVTVITMNSGDQLIGVTASSFNTVSLNPPLVLWSVDKSAFSAELFKSTPFFAVNVLADTQIEISNRFASRGADKFAQTEFELSELGNPLIHGCNAQFECKSWAAYDGGDHHILVGEVINYYFTEESSPLVFAQGKYCISEAHPNV